MVWQRYWENYDNYMFCSKCADTNQIEKVACIPVVISISFHAARIGTTQRGASGKTVVYGQSAVKISNRNLDTLISAEC